MYHAPLAGACGYLGGAALLRASSAALLPREGMWEHTMAVLDTAAELRPQGSSPWLPMLAALGSLAGVAANTESGGVIHAYGHEEAGLPPAGGDFLRRVIGDKALHRVRE